MGGASRSYDETPASRHAGEYQSCHALGPVRADRLTRSSAAAFYALTPGETVPLDQRASSSSSWASSPAYPESALFVVATTNVFRVNAAEMGIRTVVGRRSP